MKKKDKIGIIILILVIIYQIYCLIINTSNSNLFDITKNEQKTRESNYILTMFLDIIKEKVNENSNIYFIGGDSGSVYFSDYGIEKGYIEYYLSPLSVSNITIIYNKEKIKEKFIKEADYIFVIGENVKIHNVKTSELFNLYKYEDKTLKKIISLNYNLYDFSLIMRNFKINNFDLYIKKINNQRNIYNNKKADKMINDFLINLKNNNDISYSKYLRMLDGDN